MPFVAHYEAKQTAPFDGLYCEGFLYGSCVWREGRRSQGRRCAGRSAPGDLGRGGVVGGCAGRRPMLYYDTPREPCVCRAALRGGAADGSCRPGVVGGRAGRRHKGGPMGTFGLARSSPPLENFWQWSRGTLSFPPAFPAGAAPLSSKELKYLDFLGRVPYPSPSTGESGTNLLLISPNPAPRLRRPQFQRVDGLVSWVSAIRSNADRAQGLRPVSI
jgi:hypothetical protein